MLLYYFHPGLYFAFNSVYIILVSSIMFPHRVILCSNPVKKLFHNRVLSSKISVHKKKLLVVIEYELKKSESSFFLSFTLDLQW